jgi:hypothetical protein
MSDPKLYQTHDGTWVFEHDSTVMFLQPSDTQWHQYDIEPEDVLATLEGWLTVGPSDTIAGTERANLLEDIAAGCMVIRRRCLRRMITGESEDK